VLQSFSAAIGLGLQFVIAAPSEPEKSTNAIEDETLNTS
jgi:hypothetical protein